MYFHDHYQVDEEVFKVKAHRNALELGTSDKLYI